jgi:cobalt-zinc-cadmium efflux system outer membrane protein
VYFTIPVWDRNQGNIRAAGANVRQSVAQLSSVQNDLLRQLAEALARYQSAQITVETYETGILPDARRTLNLVQQGYAAQQLDFLRTLQTQRSLVEANLDYIGALQERLTAASTIAGLLQLSSFREPAIRNGAGAQMRVLGFYARDNSAIGAPSAGTGTGRPEKSWNSSPAVLTPKWR